MKVLDQERAYTLADMRRHWRRANRAGLAIGLAVGLAQSLWLAHVLVRLGGPCP